MPSLPRPTPPAPAQAEKARKERRKQEEAAKAEATRALAAATAAEDVGALEAALKAALDLGCDKQAEAVASAEARLAQLSDPDWRKRKERELRAAAAERRLGGLTLAQEKFMRGEKAL